MSRTLSGQEAIVLGLPTLQVRTRVLVKDSTGAWVDYSNLEGVNWVASVEYGEDIDQPVADANIKLWRAVEDLSIAPLVTGSKINNSTGSYAARIDVGRAVKIETATLPEEAAPLAGDWRLVFEGEVDEVDWGSDGSSATLTLVCRDKGAILMDRFLEKEGRTDGSAYGSDAGVAVETVMQQILDDWAPGVTLYTPNGTAVQPIAPGDAANWFIKPYGPRKQSVMDALRELAEMIGYEVRYRWSNITNEFRLEFFEPDRLKTVPDITLSPFQYYSVNRAALSRASVRNFIVVSYQTDPDDDTSRTSRDADDPESIAKYGRRYMEIAESASSAINTGTEAQKMANAALADLKDPKVELEADCAYRFDVQLGDLIRFKANKILFDTDHDLAAVSVRHRLSEGKARSIIAVRTKPAGGYYSWIKKGAWPGLADFIRTLLPKTPAVTASSKIQGAILRVTNLQNYRHLMNVEFHISTVSGFTPGPSTLFARSQTDRAEIAGLVQGTTYYAKSVVTWFGGLKSSVSSEISFVPGQVQGIDLADLIITTAKLADGAVTNAKVNDTAGIVGTKLAAGAGVLAHLNSSGILDDLTSITRRVLDDIADGSTGGGYGKLLKELSSSGSLNLSASAQITGSLAGSKITSGTITAAQMTASFPVDFFCITDRTFSTGTTQVPYDNTQPLASEGTQFLSTGSLAAIGNGANTCTHVAIGMGFLSQSVDNAWTMFIHLANIPGPALAAAAVDPNGADDAFPATVLHEFAGATVGTAYNYAIRAGIGAAGTITWLGQIEAQLYSSSVDKGAIWVSFYRDS